MIYFCLSWEGILATLGIVSMILQNQTEEEFGALYFAYLLLHRDSTTLALDCFADLETH